MLSSLGTAFHPCFFVTWRHRTNTELYVRVAEHAQAFPFYPFCLMTLDRTLGLLSATAGRLNVR
jgi:hypothetical protein